MKRLFILGLAALSLALAVQATGTIDVLGTVYNVDTLFYSYVGPGTTQTSLMLTSGSKQLRVFYTDVDITNPYVSIKAVSAKDKFAGSETVSQMAKRKDAPGARYYIGVNGDFWYTGGTTKRGESYVGGSISSCIAEGTVYRAQSNDGEYQFTIDAQQHPSMGSVQFGGTIANASGASMAISGVNRDAVNNAITIYNPTYFAGTNTASGCAEVQVRYVDGDDSFAWGKNCKLVVVNSPSTSGDMDVPSEGLVLTGLGTGATFISALSQGDTLTMCMTASLGGIALNPMQVISGQPWVLQNGKIYNNGDASVHPRTVLGYSQDGKTVIFMVVDGRSTISDGITTAGLGALMQYAGAYNALNVDGGGSSCLYSSALGVRNVPSDGRERADANGIFAVSNAPDDSVVSQIRFVDWALNIPKYGTYTPKFYGYNQYGMLVDTDLQGVTIACSSNVGTIKNGNTFFAQGEGTGTITATYQGHTATLPVSVLQSAGGIQLVNDSVITDTYRTYKVQLQSTVLDKTMAIDPAALTWKSTNESVVKVDPATGVLQGVADGTASVIGTLGDIADTLKVIVERPTAHVMAIDPNLDVTTWKFSQSGGKNATETANGNGGITYSYTGSSSRASKIVLSKELRLWSLPDTVRLRINPGEATFKNVVFGLRAAGQNLSYQTVTPDTIIAGKEMTIDVPTSSWLDASDMANYPITLQSIQLNMNSSTSGKQYTIEFAGFETVYNAVEPSAKRGDLNHDGAVNTSDVTTLINMVLGTSVADMATADLNSDGAVNTSDVTSLINIILNH